MEENIQKVIDNIYKAEPIVELNDFVPGRQCGEFNRKYGMSVVEQIKKTIKPERFVPMLIKQVPMLYVDVPYRRHQYCVYPTLEGGFIIYINFWEFDKYDEWGSRMCEVKIMLNNIFDPNDLPNLPKYLRGFNDRYATELSNYNIKNIYIMLQKEEEKYIKNYSEHTASELMTEAWSECSEMGNH